MGPHRHLILDLSKDEAAASMPASCSDGLSARGVATESSEALTPSLSRDEANPEEDVALQWRRETLASDGPTSSPPRQGQVTPAERLP